MSLIVKPERDYNFELIRKFDRITFNMDLIKSIIKYVPNMTDSEIRENLRKHGKEYGIHKWHYLPRENEQFQVRRVDITKNGEMFISPMPLAKDRLKGMTSGGCSASLIQRIFWYDGGNGNIISNGGWLSHWEDSKIEAIIFISIFNSELFQEWNHMYYTFFLNQDKKTKQCVITPYNKQILNEMGLNL